MHRLTDNPNNMNILSADDYVLEQVHFSALLVNS